MFIQDYFTERFPKENFDAFLTQKNARKKTAELIYILLTTPLQHGGGNLISFLVSETQISKNKMLNLFFDLIPKFCEQIKVKDLEFSWHSGHSSLKMVLMHELTRSQEGLALLYKLLVANPKLTSALPTRLFLMIPEGSGITILKTMLNTFALML